MKVELERFGRRRSEVLQRDNNKCVVCNGTTRLCIHHKDGSGRGKPSHNNSLDNLVTLCNSCHNKIHATEQWKKISPIAPDGMKTCSYCSERKSLDSFGSDNSRRDKKNNVCKDCVKQRSWKQRQDPKWQDYFKQYREERRLVCQ
jgi:hypothetical protein